LREKIKRIAILLNAVVLAVVILIYYSHVLGRIDNILIDYNMKQAATHLPDEHIVVVAIDDESLQDLGRFPWDRAVYPVFLDMLNQPGGEPAAIAFDIAFNEDSDPDSDAAFAEGLSYYDNVILPVIGASGGDVFATMRIHPDEWPTVYSVSKPIPAIAEQVETAHINRVISDDAVIRQVWLKIRTQEGEIIPSLAYKAAQMAGVDLSSYDALTDPNTEPGKKSARNTLTINTRM